MNSLVYFILFVCCSTVCFVSAEVPTSVEEEESTCKRVAYSQALECIKHGYEPGSENHKNCLIAVVLNYVNCEKLFENESIEDSYLEAVTCRTAGEQLIGKMSVENIKCIIQNVMELVNCIVDKELKPNVPFKWDWMALTSCVMVNISKYAACIPKKQL